MKHPVGIVLLALLCGSCGKEAPPEPPFARTVLVYLGRDNDLSGSDDDKIPYLLRGWNGAGNMVFYQDLPNAAPQLTEAFRDGNTSKTRVIREYPEENSADAAVFGRVLRDVRTLYPADAYGMILFSHASGWLPEGALADPRAVRPQSLVVDRGAEMELIEFAAEMPDGMFDFIIFEACLMAGVEVAYELKDKTDYLLASSAEILSPGFSAVYPGHAGKLFLRDVATGLRDVARAFYDWTDAQQGAYRSATVSVIQTGALPALAHYLRQKPPTLPADVSSIQHFDRQQPHLFFDFEAYHSALLPDDASRDTLSRLIRRTVIYERATPSFMTGYNGFDIVNHSGLTVYMEQEALPRLNAAYRKLQWWQATHVAPQ